MNHIILYTTHCPKCEILAKKLIEKGVEFEVVTDMDEMLRLGMRSAPSLRVDGELLGFGDAVEWVNGMENAE